MTATRCTLPALSEDLWDSDSTAGLLVLQSHYFLKPSSIKDLLTPKEAGRSAASAARLVAKGALRTADPQSADALKTVGRLLSGKSDVYCY